MVRFCFLACARWPGLRFLTPIPAVAARFLIPGTPLALPNYHRCRITQF
ncbi:hypothetical protein BN134_231 [Cronobacter dublinensis 1210]|uniref:Uncharacterized protein n=1 Tax=Cronobacter dublinensis 1210 TaxID=1208656 RepID=A0ABP1W361_9ENTR|nr:hypothetical protein BN134_231 [Cronobacter dublinensis 1210]CCJ87630.1 hypothetical protein BN133_4007 [Cronobacter dublinensis 582]